MRDDQRKFAKSQSKLRSAPVNISNHAWYYEESRHISVYHQVYDSGGSFLETIHTNIPWKKLLESVRRKYPSLGS